jgi:bacterioferritin-associated ferredoxin
MYICVCHGITDRQIRRAVDEGARTLFEVQMQLPVGACCGRCADSAEALIHDQQHGHALSGSSARVLEPEPA